MSAAVWDEAMTHDSGRAPGGGAAARRWLAVAAGVVVLATGVSMALEHAMPSPLLPLETVRFEGEMAHVREADLREAVSPHMGHGLLGVGVAAIRRDVEALPWVNAAAVRRVWPDALRITVTEERPVARWGEDRLLNPSGALFAPTRHPDGLPRLSGPPDTAARVLRVYRGLAQRLAPIGLTVIGLHLDERRSWQADLAGGGVLRLGREGRATRLQRLVTAWPEVAGGDRRPALIDLRYPNGFSVRWQGGGDSEHQAPKGRANES